MVIIHGKYLIFSLILLKVTVLAAALQKTRTTINILCLSRYINRQGDKYSYPAVIRLEKNSG